MDVVNIRSLLADNPEGTFLDLVSFNDNSFGTCNITGVSPVWEMHPDTDEFFYILDGEFEITLLEGAGAKHYVAPAGSSFVVPKGIWHKPAAPDGAKFIYFTSGQTLHSEREDPRVGDG